MVKILSQSGTSLADLYDVEGSIAGIEQLDTRELPIVHEMGATLFAERFNTTIRRGETAGILQNANFDIEITDLPSAVFRIFGVSVFINNTARVLFASVSVRAPNTLSEFPIWVWDQAVDIEVRARLAAGGAVSTRLLLRPVQLLEALPQMMAGEESPNATPVRDIVLRGTTAGFGAGTVVITVLVHIGFSQLSGLSSHGLPIPSW